MRYILVPFLLEYLAAEVTVVFSDKYLSQASLYCSKTTACGNQQNKESVIL